MTSSPPDSIPIEELSLLAGPAPISPWRVFVSDWLEHARGSSGRPFSSSASFAPGGSSWRTSLASCHPSAPAPAADVATGATADQLTLFPEELADESEHEAALPDEDDAWHSTAGGWVPSSGGWANSGIGGPTECWTLSTSESPSDAVASSLSDILETTGEHLRKYFLSPKAAAGILVRAARRGRPLPPELLTSLKSLASRQPSPEAESVDTGSMPPPPPVGA